MVDGFFARATHKALQEQGGRSITISSFAAMAGVARWTVYTWLKGLAEIKRTTLQHKLKDQDPVGELAREVEKYYQLQDARKRAKNIADFWQIHRNMGGVIQGKFYGRPTKAADDYWIDYVQ